MLEAAFRLLAVKENPRLLLQIARHEHLEDRKWAKPAAQGLGQNIDSDLDQQWSEISDAIRKEFPNDTLTEAPLSAWDAANSVGVSSYYDTHYRLYCQFTHASYRATMGDLDCFEYHDVRTVCFGLMIGVGGAASIGGKTTRPQEFWERLSTS